jgi:hypothetical protein
MKLSWISISVAVKRIILFSTLHTDAGYILVVYVDEIVMIGDDCGGIIRLKQFL